jgi:filamentous hemagglutinin family protein
MRRSRNHLSILILSVLGILALDFNLKAIAQSITPANDGTGTTVNLTGDNFTIDGGSRSGDGINLFHSFEQFGLTSGQSVEFLSNPQIQNILSRVVGGDASIINGLIEVTGGNSNLYLLNPAGIVFGVGASLNVLGDFTATSATGIRFSDNDWFNVFGSNNYTELNGIPSQFAFDLAPTGIIINSGNLTLSAEQNLTLLGGAVINTGTLATEGGNILISAVPGRSTIRISQPGNLLSLEIEPPRDSQGNLMGFQALDLPELLTGTDTRLTANGDGNIQFNDSETIVPFAFGTTLSTGIIDSSSAIGQGGTIHFLGDKVALLDNARVDISGETGGGIARIGGDYLGSGTLPNARFNFGGENVSINADARNTGDGGTVIIWADEATRFYGNISARGGQNGGNGGFIETSGKDYLDVFGVSVDASAVAGNAGEWLLDPRNVIITNVTNGGSFTGGVFTPTSDDATINVADILGALAGGMNVTITTGNTGNQDGDITVAAAINPANVAGNLTLTLDAADDIFINADITNGDTTTAHQFNIALVAVGDIDTTGATIDTSKTIAGGALAPGGNITMQAGGTIATGSLNTSAVSNVGGAALGGDISITSGSSINITGAIATSGTNAFGGTAKGGDISLTSGRTPGSNITFTTIDATANNATTLTGGNVTINAYGLVRGSGTLVNGNTIDTATATGAGTISITHDGGFDNIDFTVGGSTTNGTAGGLNASTRLASGAFPVLANGGIASGTPTGISITSINSPPTLNTLSTTVLNSGEILTLSYNDLITLANDVDADNLILTLNNFTSLGTLTLNGVAVTDSSVTISAGDILIYTPPSNFSGTIAVFDVGASDVVSNSNEITVNASSSNASSSEFDSGFSCTLDCDDRDLLETTPDTAGDRTSASWLLATFCRGEKRRSIHAIETLYSEEYARYLDLDAPDALNWQQVQTVLKNAESKTGVSSGAIYLAFCPKSLVPPLAREIQGEKGDEAELKNTSETPEAAISLGSDRLLRDDDRLVLVLVAPEGEPMRYAINATRGEVRDMAIALRMTVTNVRRPDAYLKPAQQMYDWLLAPLEADLKDFGIQHLTYIVDAGIRTTPLAALHDGQGFAIERYSISLMPNISASDLTPNSLKEEKVLAMGADRFSELPPLPAVPVELELIAEEIWQGDKFINEEFTVKTLNNARQNFPYGIIHLATHGDFRSGNLSESYIQFWDSRLSLDRLRDLRWNFPSVEMLVLSACRTALGDTDAELGFAGLAVAAGVNSSLGSLWYVNDEGTLGLMSQFYAQLQDAPIRAEALRQAQLKMLRQEVRFEAGNLMGMEERVILPPNLSGIGDRVLSHPYYWSAFTMVGNPF